jgi:hypothetical protein
LWTAIWAEFEERNAEMDAERRKVAEKLSKRPNRYVCAAKACGIVANTGKVLLQCGFTYLKTSILAIGIDY